jgi:hypothetical protein
MAARGAEDLFLDAIQCLRAMADENEMVYWHLLASIGLHGETALSSQSERAVGKRLHRRADQRFELVASARSKEKQAWLRRQLDGLGKEKA